MVPPLRLLKVEPKMVIKISNLRWGQLQYSKNSFCIKANAMSKLLLISHLLLGEKTVRASAPNSDSFLADSPADSGQNSGETQWACLRHAHALARSEPLSSVLVRGRGLDPPRLAAHAPQACLATITTPARYFVKFRPE